MAQRRLPQGAVLGKIVQANNFMACLQQFFHEIAANEAGGTGDKYFHGE